jgi:hypothetical protein
LNSRSYFSLNARMPATGASMVRPTWPRTPFAASPASSITFCPMIVVSPTIGLS